MCRTRRSGAGSRFDAVWGLTNRRTGHLGIPVIEALRTLRWSFGAGTLECGFRSSGPNLKEANLAFDGASPVTEVIVEGKRLEFSFDSGAQNTDLYPKFAKTFPNLANLSAKKESRTLTGVDGSAQFDSLVLPLVELVVGGRKVSLKPAHVLLAEHNSNSAWYFGNLGMDLLNQADEVDVDLESMKLTLR